VCDEPAMARSAGTANSGVPAKATRSADTEARPGFDPLPDQR